MHEWALAEAVIESVKKYIGNRSLKDVERVVVGFGELQNIDLEIFKFGLSNILGPDSDAAKIFTVEIERASFRCNSCGYIWNLAECDYLGEDEREAMHFLPEASRVYISCPKCGSRDFEVISGRGVVIKHVALKKRDGDDDN